MKTAGLFEREENDMLYNASVGNGWVSINTYIDGYQAATLVMLDSVLKSVSDLEHIPNDANHWNMDTAIYPILFSARHYIELYLKHKIYAINFFKLKNDIETRLIRTHDINKLWSLFISIVDQTHDSRLNEFIVAIEPYISDFSKIDLTGETFRYPYNQDYTQKHLEGVSLIGLYNFHEKFIQLSSYLTSFTFFMDSLVDEYRVGTYTKHLNRNDIESIAKQIPIYEEWRSKKFANFKDTIKSRFSIGSKEFSQVIDIIKNHIEFKRYIFPSVWDLIIDKEKIIRFVNNSFCSNDIDIFTNEEVACLRTLVELGTSIINGKYYSEDYFTLYESFLNKIKNEEYQKKLDYKYSLENINRILKGIEKIGYSSVISF